MTKTHSKDDIQQFNSFLRGEISAVETYEQAIKKAEDPHVLAVLRENRASHAERVALLEREIRALGGEPSKGSGVWGGFAKAVEGGAKLFGESAAIAALEEGEDHGLADYKADLSKLSPAHRSIVTLQLLPKQQQTHDAARRLKARK